MTLLTDRQLILSSSSPARRELLSRLQVPFFSTTPDVDESPLSNESNEALVLRVAVLKAQAAAAQFPSALIIGADTIGTLNRHRLTKPLTQENAFKQLQTMSGNMIRFYTGLCLLDANNHHQQTAVEIYDVYFRKLSDTTIKHYLEHEDVLNCAGSFHAEGLGITLIEKFAGNDYTALIGLPLIQLTGMLMRS